MEAGATGKGQLLFALAILVAFAAALAIAAGRSEPPAAGAAVAPAEPEDLAHLATRLEPKVARKVEELRGLRFHKVPEPEVVDSDYLNRLGQREYRRAGVRQGLGADEAELRILGVLAPDEQLESIYGATGDLAAAAYDPHTDRLYVVSDAVNANQALVEFVLSHELTHALEDQVFGLSNGAHLDDDASLALTALTEGSATAMMIDYASQHISATDLLGATAALGADDAGVPQFYVDQLTWTYLGGARFVTALRALAGSWKLVDHAIADRPPATTEQVLHPDKYIHDEQPLPVSVATNELVSQGWRRADRAVAGELSTSQLLELGVDKTTAERAAAGWGGDRYELWRQGASPNGCEDPCRADFVLVADWRMDTTADVGELRDALDGYVSEGLGGESVGSGVWRVDAGFAAVQADGDRVALVFAPNADTATAVAAEQVTP